MEDSPKTRIVNQLKAEIAEHTQQQKDIEGFCCYGSGDEGSYVKGCLDSYRYALQIVRKELPDGR